MKIATFDLEKKLLSDGYEILVGVDEAGRGPLAGPVVACATTIRNFKFLIPDFELISNDQILNFKKKENIWDLIRDSKTLSEKQREKAYDFIMENFYVGVGICDHETIDRINILQSSFLAMKKSITELSRKVSDFKNKKIIILADGKLDIPNLSLMQKAVISGDSKVKSIAAASIIAKVTRDKIMKEMHEKYPQYGFDRHKGYGTKAHMDALKNCGPCEIHRKSFKPVKTYTQSMKCETRKMKHGA